ncbi:MAG TPA: response regulator transcription factor [Dehalococcoidia bacterium]|nr:response regulator transcription factor [Dehalococcoidia bacterium]
MDKIRILVADDHTLIRRGIVGLLNAQPDMQVVDEAGTGDEAVTKTRTGSFDLVLMDISMPGLGGLEATRAIKKQVPGVQVLILTMHEREDYLFQAVRAGASGYVLKGADIQDLLAAVRSVHRGEVYLFPPVAKKLLLDYLRRVESGEDLSSYDGLTEREREVLQLVAQGKTAAQIAEVIHVSPHTVQSHRDNIMAKLGMHNRAQLVKYAIQKGIIPMDS